MTATGKRTVVSASQTLNAPPHDIFPLLCPVREYDWIEDWSCTMISSRSGYAELNCVFTTAQDRSDESGRREVWIVSRYEPGRAISFVKFCDGLYVVAYDIGLTPEGPDQTRAVWTQTRIPLNAEGATLVATMTSEAFCSMIQVLEEKLNRYLRTGNKG